MKIESLHIDDYRCLSDFRIDFDERLTVLVGENGSGKTAILDALALFLAGFSGNVRQ
ncbi:MAG: ATP-binding protein, partial [Deltaproteobacteria bacterium]|nr:ATP-binding protein [Deltaproteobacteria bacterium]